jgi:predicted nucleic acid-binding protein
MEEFSQEQLITARMTELVDHRTPWHRSLWQLGTYLAIREVLEYADGVRAGVMRSEGLEYVTQSASRLVARDRGLGAKEVRERMTDILDKRHTKQGVVDPAVADELDQLARRSERGYLRRWSRCVATELPQSEVELFSRLIAAHMLDAGFSADHLHGWLLASSDEGLSLEDRLEQADEMFGRAPVDYRVVVPFASLPSEVLTAASERFVKWDDLPEFLRSEGVERLPPGRKGVGALVFSIRAREPKAAIEATEIEVRRLAARVVVGLSSKTANPAGYALALGATNPRWMQLRPRQKEILVSAIVRHRLLLPAARQQETHALDDAFELLAAFETATSWASVAAIWAAVEGLLARAGDSGAKAADRMANVVAGGFIRAELTQLTDVLARRDDELGRSLAVSGLTQSRKLDKVLSEFSKSSLKFDNPADAAGAERVRSALADPATVLTRVRAYYMDAFRRLFNQRNLLLHGGRFNSVALPATIRTVPPLVAAGLDRLVHASMQESDLTTFGLAARAETEIELLATPGARRLHRLLD